MDDWTRAMALSTAALRKRRFPPAIRTTGNSAAAAPASGPNMAVEARMDVLRMNSLLFIKQSQQSGMLLVQHAAPKMQLHSISIHSIP
jgi:hypothetical protein